MARRKKRPNKNLQPGETPQRLKWRPRFRIIGFLSGLIGGLGAVLLVAQYGVAPLSRALSVQGLMGAFFSGLILPSVVFAIVVSIHNKRLDRALAKTTRARAGGRGASPTLNTILLLLLATIFVAPFLDTRVAHAEVSGPCGGEINGIDLEDVEANAADAFEILEGQTVRGSLFVDGDVTGGRAGLSMFGFEIAGDLESSSGTDGREEFEFDYEDISWLGSGLIELWVDAEMSTGENCEIRFMINIDGDPLETVVGQVAAGAVGVGAAGMTLSGAGAILEGGRTMGDLRRALTQIASSEGVGLDVDALGDTSGGGGSGELQSLNYQSGGSTSVTVAQGDNLWSLSENELQNRLGRPPTDAETAQFWQQVVDANTDSLQSGDPDLIMPGETIEFPDGGLPDGGAPTEVPTSAAGVAGEASSVGDVADAAPTTDAGGGLEPESISTDTVSTDVAGASETASDTSWWQGDAADASSEPRTVVAEGIDAATASSGTGLPIDAASVAGIAGLTAAALLVPARYLLLEKLAGTADPDVIDPRLGVEIDRQLESLSITPSANDTLRATALEKQANDSYNQLVEMLSADFVAPSSVPHVTSWPPRVGTAIAWMHVADTPPLSSTDIADICDRSAYIDNILHGHGRTIALIEEKATWPWT